MSDPSQDTVALPTTEAPNADEVRLMLEGSPDRLATKMARDDEAEEPEREIRPPRDPNVIWQQFPSIPDQLQKMPQTVRTGPQIDAVFNLSIKSELAEFNLLQGQATNHVDGQTVVIHHLTKEFHQGQFYALITYSKLFYQKLQ